MVQRISQGLAEQDELDETAWLEATAELIRSGCWDQVDAGALAEYLTDMARRDKREILSRLAVVIAHLLKWQFQPQGRSRSWLATVERERQELLEVLESGSLRNHAGVILDKAYHHGVKQAAAETGLPAMTFPANCPWTLDALLSEIMSDE